jgi:CcmD family protein
MVILLVIWFGVYAFLWSTDKRLKEIEKEIKEQ